MASSIRIGNELFVTAWRMLFLEELRLLGVPLDDLAKLRDYVVDREAELRVKQPGKRGRSPKGLTAYALLAAAFEQAKDTSPTLAEAGAAAAKRLGVARSAPAHADGNLERALRRLLPDANHFVIEAQALALLAKAAEFLALAERQVLEKESARSIARRGARHLSFNAGFSAS